jgi:alpha-D-xyloside xylohydrolase
VLRPLGYGFPDDPQAWRTGLQLLVGPDLLAAPVTGPGESPSVYLPEGRWVDLHAGTTVDGGVTFVRPTRLEEFPLYARDGTVIPFNLRTERDPWWGLNELEHPGRAGFLATDGARLDLEGQPGDVQIFVPAPARPREVTLDGDPVAWTWHDDRLRGVVVRVRGPAVSGVIAISA